jgi:EAL domain-containing protein (putative c-di-GMP-specific phosphodiesterase class I)
MDTFTRERFDGRKVVFQSGDPGTSAYVIEEGCVEVLVGSGENLRRVTVLAQGAMFGEIALLDHQPRTATVRTLVPTSLIRIDRSHIEELLLRADPVIQYLLRLLLARFRSSNGVASEPGRRRDDSPDRGHEAVGVRDLHTAAVRTLSLAQDLSNAIGGNQLELFYQPIIALQDLSLAGFESLIRWHHPVLGLVNPIEFIPLAEKTGLIHRIGQWVLQRAVADWSELRAHCPCNNGAPPFLSVNLSAPELGSDGIVDAIDACLAQHGMRPNELRIELTETIIINSVQTVSTALNRLRAAGVGIALDDFGTGYAGLDYLQTLPFSCIKIDKTFVQQMNGSERSFYIVKSALELARSLGLTTVAEGIEDADIGRRLAEMGCTYAQGFHYGSPMSKPDIAGWFERYQRANPHAIA